MENQFEIIVQDEALFKIESEHFFVSYIEDSQIEEQGIRVRARFNNTVGELQ